MLAIMCTLQTNRLLLRAFRQDDLREVMGWAKAGENCQKAEVEAQKFLDFCAREYRERGIGPWALELKENGRIAGNCGLPKITLGNLCGELNYCVLPQYQNLGLATEAASKLIEYGFRYLGLKRIEAWCELDNTASERVLQKAGMQFERLVRQGLFRKAKYKVYAVAPTSTVSLSSRDRPS